MSAYHNKKGFFNTVKRRYKQIRRRKWAGIVIDIFINLILFAIAGGIGILIALGKNAGSPEKYAEEYFSFYANQNWQSMYECFEIRESEHVDYDTFVRQMDADPIYVKESSVKLKKKTKGRAYIEVSYINGDDEEKVLEVVLIKQREKKYKFFSTWKVDPSGFIAENYQIKVPQGTEVTFDGMSAETLPKSTADGYVTYTIRRLFRGEHEIGISTMYIDPYSQSVYVEGNDGQFNLDIKDFAMKSDDIEYVRKTAGDVTFGMYANALAKSGVDDLKGYFVQSESVQTALQECYDALLGEVYKSNGAVLKSINVNERQIYDFAYTYPNEVEVRVDFKCTFEAKTGRTMINGVRGNYSGEAESQVRVIYALDGTEWKIKELDLTCFDYSPK